PGPGAGALSGRAILLTGGGSGIGRAVALAYAGQGATVTLLERSADNAEQLRRADDRLRVLVGDATDPSVVEEAVAAAAEPTGQLDNLTCTVGVLDRKSTRLNSSHVKTSYAVFCLK